MKKRLSTLLLQKRRRILWAFRVLLQMVESLLYKAHEIHKLFMHCLPTTFFIGALFRRRSKSCEEIYSKLIIVIARLHAALVHVLLQMTIFAVNQLNQVVDV